MMTPRTKELLEKLKYAKKNEDVTEAAFEVLMELIDDVHSIRSSLETIAKMQVIAHDSPLNFNKI